MQNSKPKTTPAENGSAIKSSTIYAAGNIARQLVSFIMLPVYTRYLTPSDYGVVGLISFAIAMFETLVGAKLVQALPKYYHDQPEESEKRFVVSTAFIVTGIISAITVTLLYLFKAPMSVLLFSTKKYSVIVGLCSIQMLTQAMEYYALMYIRLKNRPLTFIWISLSKLVVQLSLNIAFVVIMKLGVLGVAISGLASSAMYAVGLSIWTLMQTGLIFKPDLAKRMVAFSWPLWLSGLASLYTYSSNRYYIRLFDSLNNVGLYELAAKFSGILTLIIWVPFYQYWQTEQFRIAHGKNAHHTLDSTFRFLSCLLVMAGLGISIFSEPVIRLMAAPVFYHAVNAVPFLLVMAVFASLTEFIRVGFFAEEQTGWISKNTYITALVVTALYFLLIPLLGYVGAAIALAGAQIFQFLSTSVTARKRRHFAPQLAPLIQMGVTAIAAYALSYMTNHLPLWIGIASKAVIFLGASGALLLILCSDRKSKEQLISFSSDLIGTARIMLMPSRTTK